MQAHPVPLSTPCARMLRTRRSGVRAAPPPLPLKLIYSSLWVVWQLTELENGTGNAASVREDGRYTALLVPLGSLAANRIRKRNWERR